ncbi:HAD family hydrolase [Niabella sp. CJ426]|uniref:HAD family hydrolase n=1 Tax=Niabella sp. CJ426 TaxID=3393740 RepID=UPI003CFC4B77
MHQYKAFLFDLNGTMIDDMEYHIKAWYRILNELGAEISMEKTKEECYGKNHELLDRVFPGRFSLEEKNKMSIEKERQYQEEFRPHLQLLAGLPEVLEHYHSKGIKMAIGSAAIMYNIDFVLDGLGIRHYFQAIVSADDVGNSKPDPETYLKCAALLQTSPSDCLVFEDAPKGVDAAANAGMDCFVLTTMHHKDEFTQQNIIGFAKDFENFNL